jgi:hypothetical protein
LYSAFANVPATAVKIQWGVMLNGRGSMWVDVDSAKLEIADGVAR